MSNHPKQRSSSLQPQIFKNKGWYQTRNGSEKLLIKPSKKNVHTFLTAIRKIIKKSGSFSQAQLICKLNPKIRGWAYYHRFIVASKTF